MRVWVSVIPTISAFTNLVDEEESFLCDNQLVIPPVVGKKKTHLCLRKKMSECIYKFVEQPQAKKPKKQIYKSKYDHNGPLIGSTFCMQGTTVVDGKGFHSLKQVSGFNVLCFTLFSCCSYLMFLSTYAILIISHVRP